MTFSRLIWQANYAHWRGSFQENLKTECTWEIGNWEKPFVKHVLISKTGIMASVFHFWIPHSCGGIHKDSWTSAALEPGISICNQLRFWFLVCFRIPDPLPSKFIGYLTFPTNLFLMSHLKVIFESLAYKL